MILNSDVLLDPYRPGVLEAIGSDPVKLLEENERLVVARVTGYGQTGDLANIAGHDINYVALSGSSQLIPSIFGNSTITNSFIFYGNYRHIFRSLPHSRRPKQNAILAAGEFAGRFRGRKLDDCLWNRRCLASKKHQWCVLLYR